MGCALQIYLVAILGACGGGTEAELSFAVAVVSLALAANIASAGLWLVLIASACCWSSALDDQSFARRCVVPCVIVCAVPIHALELALTVAGTWLIAWSSLAGACDGTWLIALVLLAGSWLRLVCAAALSTLLSCPHIGCHPGHEPVERASELSDLFRALFCLIAPRRHGAPGCARLACGRCRRGGGAPGSGTRRHQDRFDELFTTLGLALDRFFGGSDLVGSDIVLGALLLFNKQRDALAREHRRLQLVAPAGVVLHPQAAVRGAAAVLASPPIPAGEATPPAPPRAPAADAAAELEAAAYFCRYATAIYGVKLHAYMHGGRGAWCCGGAGGGPSGHGNAAEGSAPVVENEEAPHLDTAALLRVIEQRHGPPPPAALRSGGRAGSAADAEDATKHSVLVYVDWLCAPALRVPIAVALDYSTRTVVVATRGTITLRDAMTDLVVAQDVSAEGERAHLDDASLAELAREHGFACASGRGAAPRSASHPGFVAVASATALHLRSLGVLDELLLPPAARGDGACRADIRARIAYVRRKYGGGPSAEGGGDGARWSLQFVGHSLGAATAGLLSLFLRRRYAQHCERYHCFAYACPGACGTIDVARQCDAWVTTVVVGDDWVPRLSLLGMENLRDSVLLCLVEAARAGETAWQTWARALCGAARWSLCWSRASAAACAGAEGGSVGGSSSSASAVELEAPLRSDTLEHLLGDPLFEAHGATRRARRATRPMYPLGRILYLWPQSRARYCRTQTCPQHGCADHSFCYGDVLGALPFHGRARATGSCGVTWPTFYARWETREDFCSKVVVLSAVMGDDHFPNKTQHALSHCRAAAASGESGEGAGAGGAADVSGIALHVE